MTYATREDMVKRFGSGEMADLETAPAPACPGPRSGNPVPGTDDPGSESGTGPQPTARIDTAIADASTEIDAQLAARFALPLSPGLWPRLVPIACDIARARLYDDKVPEAVANRARSARKALGEIATGKAVLVDAAGNPAPVRAAALAERAGPEPVMTRDNLAGL